MRYFLDTEFIEALNYLAPISVALVAEDGREFYAINSEHDPSKADAWVVANVLTRLPPRSDPRWMTRPEIAAGLLAFVAQDEKPEFWAYFADYDWVLFCWLHGGRMLDMPERYPKFCLDLKQAMVDRGISKGELDRPENAHEALSDARWGMLALRYVFAGPPARARAFGRVSKLEDVLRRVYAHMPQRAVKSRKLIAGALRLPPSPEPKVKKRSARRREGRDRR